MRTALLVLAAVLVAASAWAVDGVIEINQASVKAAGGFPFIINQSGSYRLTGNLDVTDATARPAGQNAEDTTAIFVQARDVTIDLNGFSILGPTTCTGSPTTNCAPTGAGIGVWDHGGVGSVAVINGAVRGMGNTGVELDGPGDRAERLRVIDNSFGIASKPNNRGLLVRGCFVSSGSGTGIITPTNSLVDGNIVDNFGSFGINLSGGNSGYENNVLNGNAAPVTGGVNLGHNLCNAALCP